MYKAKELVYGDYYDFYIGYNQHRANPNYTFVKYEDVKKNPRTEIKRVADVIEVTLSDSQMDEIENETAFPQMKERFIAAFKTFGPPKFVHWIRRLLGKPPILLPKGEDFCRKGIVGDWENHYSPALQEFVDQLHAERMRDPKAEGLECVDSI